MFCNVPTELLIHICKFMTADEIINFVTGMPDLANLFSRKTYQHIVPAKHTAPVNNVIYHVQD
jgi:hypothetical protein